MALQGRFDADFATFYDACRRAEVSMRGFDAGAQRVEATLNRMVDSFTGRQVISEAQLMTEAVSRIGGPARLTRAELERVGATAAEAVEKFQRWGQEPPEKLMRLADAAQRSRGRFDGMGRSVRQVDDILGVFGVNLGPAARAMEDLEFAFGAGATKLGLLGTATVAAGTAFGAWKLGRFVAELTDADNVVSRFTAKLLGYGDVAAQEAAAKTDVLARASASAGRQITDMAEAMAINEAAANKMIAANTKAAETFAKEEAAAKRAAEVTEANRLKLLQVEHELAVAQQKTAAEKEAKAREAAAATRKALDDEHAAALRNVEGAAKLRDAYWEAQTRAKEKTEEATKALEAERRAAEAASRALGNAIEYDLSTPEGLEEFRRLNPRATVTAPTGYFDSHSLEDAVKAGFVNFYGGTPQQQLLGRAGQTATSSTTRLVDTTTPVVQVQVSGVLDPRTVTDLAAAIAKAGGTKVRPF